MALHFQRLHDGLQHHFLTRLNDVEELYRRANATALGELSKHYTHIRDFSERSESKHIEELYKRASVPRVADSSETSENADVEELYKRANATLMKEEEKSKDELENSWMMLKQTRVMEQKFSGAYMADPEAVKRYGI